MQQLALVRADPVLQGRDEAAELEELLGRAGQRVDAAVFLQPQGLILEAAAQPQKLLRVQVERGDPGAGGLAVAPQAVRDASLLLRVPSCAL